MKNTIILMLLSTCLLLSSFSMAESSYFLSVEELATNNTIKLEQLKQIISTKSLGLKSSNNNNIKDVSSYSFTVMFIKSLKSDFHEFQFNNQLIGTEINNARFWDILSEAQKGSKVYFENISVQLKSGKVEKLESVWFTVN